MADHHRAMITRTGKIDLTNVIAELRHATGHDDSRKNDRRGTSLLDVLAEETKFLRSSRTKLTLIVPILLARLHLTATSRLREAGQAISAAAEASVSEPDYHNQLHVAEVVVAAFVLGKREGSLTDDQIGELVIAAAGHDLGHTGEINQVDYERESHSVEIALPLLVEAGVPEEIIMRIQHMILATDFKAGVPPTRDAYLETREMPADSPIRQLATQALLLTEADVLFSCFDVDYNDLLSRLLSAEWHQDESNLSLKQRIGFLSYVQFISKASEKLGLDQRRQDLLAVLQQELAAKEAAAPTPEAPAA